jgi:chromosomal replication initiation ATPase DnaA
VAGGHGRTDARILGTGEFVAAVLREAREPVASGPPARVPLETLTARLAARLGVALPALFGGTQTRPAVTARQLLAYVWVEGLGRRASAIARALGQTRETISTAARRGAVQAAR